jgi:hypothetical protein
MILPDYLQIGDFWQDYYNLDFVTFNYKVSGLKGTFNDVLKLRSRYLNGEKMSSDERKSAHKCLNNEQLEFLKNKKNKQSKNQAKALLNRALGGDDGYGR